MHFHVEQAAVLHLPHFGNTGDRWTQLTVVQDAETAGTFCDEKASVGKEGETPGRFEILRDNLELDGLLFRFDDCSLRIDLRLRLTLREPSLLADVENERAD